MQQTITEIINLSFSFNFHSLLIVPDLPHDFHLFDFKPKRCTFYTEIVNSNFITNIFLA